METAIIIVHATVLALTPLLLAGIGELIVEKSGVLNLGLEGMMLMGAASGIILTTLSGSLLLGFFAAALAGVLMASIFAVLTVSFHANQVATGLALTIFGTGLSTFVGLDYVGVPVDGLDSIKLPFLSEMPVLGTLVFQYDYVVYLAFLSLAGSHYFLFHTSAGLVLRAVGENHDAAHSMGYAVSRTRFYATLFGGAMAGLGGGYLSLAYTPLWAENMTAGRGWIVLALVVFSSWLPTRLLLGAMLFGFVSIAQLFLQGENELLAQVPAEFFSMLPYLTTIVVLTIFSSLKMRRSVGAPAHLGVPFEPQ